MSFHGTCYVLVLFANWLEPNSAVADIHLREYFDTSFSSHFPKITTSPVSVCDKKQLEDICFWKNMTYQGANRSARIGTIGPPHDPDICNIRNITYNILTGIDIIKLYPPDGQSRFWTLGLGTSQPTAKDVANISCSLLTIDTTTSFSKLVHIEPNEPKCSVLEPQDRSKVFSFYSPRIRKKDFLDNMLFLDTSSMQANDFHAIIDDKVSDFLQPNCSIHTADASDIRLGRTKTVIHCTLIATRSKILKNDITFRLGLRKLACIEEKYTGYMNVTFALEKKRIKRSNIFNNNSKIFRTAAPYARVTQPISHTKNMTDYRCTVSNVTKNPLAITNEGIVYVNDTQSLKTSPEYLWLNITWFKNKIIQFEEVSVRIVEEPGKTCVTLEDEDSWETCAAYKSEKACLKKDSCGLGTGGMTSVQTRSGPERCMWRGDKNPENHETHLYSTCSSDTKYCPDGICDSLEILREDDLCPQDCTKDTAFPSKLNDKTGRGVDKCNGVLVCDKTCTCHRKIPSNKLIIKSQEDKLVGTKAEGDNILCGMQCILMVSGGVALLVFASLFSVMLWRIVRMRESTKDKYMENLQEAETPFSDYIERNTTNEPLVLNFHMTTSLDNNSVNTLKPIKVESKWKFPRQHIFIEQILGEGEFGKVLQAKAFNVAGRPGYSMVAVKTLKDDARKQDYNDLFSEYQLLKEVNHPHVIQLLGVCSSEDGPLYLIIEYAVHGSLRNYLRRSRHILTASELGHLEDNLSHKVTPKDVLSFARQIANGMSYLSDIKLVHRDLAARNILLAENKVCKISDFGLTRDIYEDNAYFKKSKGRVPVKWMAPESLADHVYTTKSDVWSFGILIWEVITLGASPYPGIPVHNLYNLLKHGYRMERPPNCSTVLYSLMNRCWNINAEARPSFLELYHCFDNLLTDNVNYLDLSDNAIINKSYFANFSMEIDSGSSDRLEENVNFMKNNFNKDEQENDEKMINSIEEFKENCPGYETPVKAPRPVIVTPTNEVPGEYTDMNAKQK